jgi:hypothetical protein
LAAAAIRSVVGQLLLRQYLLTANWLAMVYAFGQSPVFLLNPIHLPLSLRSPRVVFAIGASAAAAIGVASYVLTRRKPSAEEIERERRDLLARIGRITDGTIMDTMVAEVHGADSDDAVASMEVAGVLTPHMIVYVYRIAGVTYECAQDVTALAEFVHGIRTDLPIQVRYEPHNPANSIVVAETWNGLRFSSPQRSQGNRPVEAP